MEHKKQNTYKNSRGYFLFSTVLISFFLLASCSKDSSESCPTKTCSDFTTQSQAQSTYDSDRECYKNLDGDGDGRACENLPN